MVLDWKSVSLIAAVLILFGVLALTGSVAKDAITTGMAGILGWLFGLFTPTPKRDG